MQFRATESPDDDLRTTAAGIDPRNPFISEAYARARASCGDSVCLFLLADDGAPVSACYGFLRNGRVNCSLEIASLPPIANQVFYDGLLRFCRRHGVTVLDVNTFASSSAVIPALPREASRRPRMEWVIDLKTPWQASVSTNHRRNIARARKAGAALRRAVDDSSLQAHLSLMRASLGRRAERGEGVPDAPAESDLMFSALTATGAGEFFQAIADETVLSSLLVLHAERGAYYHSAGTSPEGMSLGASPFLIHSVAECLEREGREVFNLGDAQPDNQGLHRFKTGFGTRYVPLAAVRAWPFRFWRNPAAAAAYWVSRLARKFE